MAVNPDLIAQSQARFCARIEPGAGLLDCWLFPPSNKDGYAKFGDRRYLVEIYAHRIVAHFIYGPIPEGHEVDHWCHTHNCVNPLHLRVCPLRENRRWAPWKRKTHCMSGHELAGPNLYVNPTTGKQTCRACMRAAQKRSRDRAKEAA